MPSWCKAAFVFARRTPSDTVRTLPIEGSKRGASFIHPTLFATFVPNQRFGEVVLSWRGPFARGRSGIQGSLTAVMLAFRQMTAPQTGDLRQLPLEKLRTYGCGSRRSSRHAKAFRLNDPISNLGHISPVVMV